MDYRLYGYSLPYPTSWIFLSTQTTLLSSSKPKLALKKKCTMCLWPGLFQWNIVSPFWHFVHRWNFLNQFRAYINHWKLFGATFGSFVLFANFGNECIILPLSVMHTASAIFFYFCFFFCKNCVSWSVCTSVFFLVCFFFAAVMMKFSLAG